LDRQALIALIEETVRGYSLTMGGAGQRLEPDTPLFGPKGVLDSLGLVSVVVELEQALSDRTGREVSLMNDRAMSQTRSPFRTSQTLADYALAQISASGPA
jgi:acyl carrier protein